MSPFVLAALHVHFQMTAGAVDIPDLISKKHVYGAIGVCASAVSGSFRGSLPSSVVNLPLGVSRRHGVGTTQDCLQIAVPGTGRGQEGTCRLRERFVGGASVCFLRFRSEGCPARCGRTCTPIDQGAFHRARGYAQAGPS